METKKPDAKKLSMTSTKQEMLDAYNVVAQQLKEKEVSELRPEKKLEEKKAKEVESVAGSLSSESIAKDIGTLKADVGKVLTQLTERLEEQVTTFIKVQQAVAVKEKELQEIYGIEKEAMTLAALIESQNKKRDDFEANMTAQRDELLRDIETTRVQWQEEKKTREAEMKEWDVAEQKRRKREKDEFDYAFAREQKLAKEKYEDEKARLEKSIATKKGEIEAELGARETAVAAREQELAELTKKVAAFPKELEAAVNKAAKDVTDRLTLESKNREELAKKEFEGERNVLKTRLESLERTFKEQQEQIAKLTQQLDRSYQKVEDIAVKAIESSATAQSFAGFQQVLGEQARKQAQEK